MPNPHSVIIIGGGSTGTAIAHDLALRGLAVTLIERGEVASGTTGRNHCLLHSGARYCVKDQESARECIEENLILRKIMPDAMELNGGLFVALTDEDMDYKTRFVEGCRECDIPHEEISGEEARRLEPYLSEETIRAVKVPDGVFEPLRMCLSFLATAKKNGAVVKPFTEAREFHMENGRVTGVRVWDRLREKEYDIYADLVVNAAGPWAEAIAQMAGVDVPVVPTPGIMIAIEGRWNQRVINRMTESGDGDIVVPQRETSIIGTSSWKVEDADYIDIPDEHIEMMYTYGGKMMPILRQKDTRGIWVVARPLIGREDESGREMPRTFKCFDHAPEGVEGFVTIAGGKTTTARIMAEKTADVVCEKLGIDEPCRTRDTELLSYRAFYRI